MAESDRPRFVNAIREDTQQKGLLFAGTELGVYVSFDDGDHWQPLQLNLPVTSVRDLTIHGDDLVIATYGRAFWVLDNITPLRQIAAGVNERQAECCSARQSRCGWTTMCSWEARFPPEEPMAKNPPDGAVIDYFLPAKADKVTLEIFDAKGTLVRRYVSGEKKAAQKLPPMPIAERWFPKPVSAGERAGMHRFVWDLRWNSSGTGEELEDEGFGAPRGPKVAPGTYPVRLTVDGAVMNTGLTIRMDPRSKATTAELEQTTEPGAGDICRSSPEPTSPGGDAQGGRQHRQCEGTTQGQARAIWRKPKSSKPL